MNFTREPIIETIISPREGNKLLVRSSKAGSSAEEYYVDALEVVSFGHAFFFRSTERPKAFLVPASDYEVVEVKEVRVALKNVSHERNIKIGGGRESPRHTPREPQPEKEVVVAEEEESQTEEEVPAAEPASSRADNKRGRDRRRRRHRRSGDEQEWSERRSGQTQQQEGQSTSEGESRAQTEGSGEEVKSSSMMFSALVPPPPTLIKDNLSRYNKFMDNKNAEPKEEKKEPPAPEGTAGADSESLSRVAERSEGGVFSSTHFSAFLGGADPFFH